MDPITILTIIAVILLVGVLLSAFAKKIKVPDIFFLILLGVIVGAIRLDGVPLMNFPPQFLESIGILALAMIVFDSSSKIKLRLVDSLSNVSLRLVWTGLLFIFVLFSGVCVFLFKMDLGSAMLLAAIMSGTSPAVILPVLSSFRNRMIEVIKLESLMNTPLTVLLPFLIIDLMQSVEKINITVTFFQQLGPFLAKFVSGLGSGILVGIVLFKLLKKAYSKVYSPLAVVISALMAYVLAENLGGNGVLAVTTLGIFFGNITLKQKVELLEVESLLAKSLYILVFVLLGSIIQVPLTAEFLFMSISLFIAYLLVRYAAIYVTFRSSNVPAQQMWFMTLMCSKGIAVSVVAFSLASFMHMAQVELVLDLTLVFILYSIIVSSIAAWFAKDFFAKE